MKKKYSIIISMCIFCIALVAIGVYAVSYLKLDVSGQIDFVAYERIVYIDKVEIKNYVETNGDNYQAKSKVLPEFSGLYLRDSDKVSTIDISKLSVLQNEDLVIEITMISLSPNFSLDVVCEYTQKAGITVTPSQTQLPKNEGEKVATGTPTVFTITISNTSTGLVNLSDISIKISFARTLLSSKADYIHISFDDVKTCFSNLSSGSYTSLWDEPFFAWLKQLNTTFGAKFSLYTYTDSIKTVGTTFLSQFQEASSWLKLGMHANKSGHIMTDIDYATGNSYWTDFVNNVKRITGTTSSLDRMPRLESFGGTYQGLFGMRDAANGALGFLSADDDRLSYYFDTNITSYLYTNDYAIDAKNSLTFLSTDIRADWFESFSTSNAYRAPVKDNVYDELVYREETSAYNNAWKSIIFFVHEWKVYSGVTINNAKATWVSDACQFAQDYNLDFDYPQNRTYSSTTADSLFEKINSSETITLTSKNNTEVVANVVYSPEDIVFSNGWAINGSGFYTETTGRAASNGYVLAVAGGEIISLKLNTLENQSLSYTIYEFTADKITNASASVNAKSWVTGDVQLHGDTRYIMIAFRNGDGSTNFSETALTQLNSFLTGFGRSFKLITSSNHEMSVKIVSSINDMKYTNNYSINGSGLFAQTSARAASLSYALAVQGGEVLSLAQLSLEGQNIAYNIFEFKEDGTVNTAGDNNRWRETKTTLHSDTKYVTIAFRYVDATTIFSETAVAQLCNCLQKFKNSIELISSGGMGVVRNIVKNINQMSFFVGYTFQGGGAIFTESTGRAADINNCLEVVGGQIVSLSNTIVEGKDVSYAICEFKEDGNINLNGEVGKRWIATDTKLHKDTAYIVIFFKNGDGTTDFTISGASELPNCITLK